MGKFIKNFGLGLLYFIALPLLILGVVCYAVYGFGVYVFYFFKGVIRFFKGDSFFEELPEETEVKAIKKALQEQAANPNPQPTPAPQGNTSNISNQDNSQQSTYNVTNNYFTNPMSPNNQNPTNGFQNPNSRIDMKVTEIDATNPDNGSQKELKQPDLNQIGMNNQQLIGTSTEIDYDSIDLLDDGGN